MVIVHAGINYMVAESHLLTYIECTAGPQQHLSSCYCFATVIPAVAPAMILQHVQCSLLPFPHPRLFLSRPLTRMNRVKALA